MNQEEALQRAAAYCSQAEHCRLEVIQKLTKWEIPFEQRETILNYLEKENYLNKQRYATAFAKDKFRYNKWGKIRIRMEMQRKGLSAEEITEALTPLEEEAYLDQAVGLVKAKLKSLKYKDNYERDGKLFRFLAGRGFEPETSRKAISCVTKEAIEESR